MPNSPFRYPGGKSRPAIRNLILSYMPSDTKEYREPFVGGGGVFFGLAPSRVSKRWINDLNPPLISVYQALVRRPDEFISLCRAIEPPVKGEEEVSTKGTGKKYNKRLGELFNQFKYNETMDQALRYYFINRTVWAGRVNYDPEFESRMYYSNPTGWNVVKREGFLEEIVSHVRGTEVTNGSYEVLLQAPGTEVWIYLDPPYVVDTKLNKGSKLYEFGFTMEQHLEFVKQCRETKHRIAISYDDVPEVREWFRSEDGFYVYEHTWKYSGTTQTEKTDGRELIITNYARPSVVDDASTAAVFDELG